MLRVAAYCRVSTSQEDQRNSLENQRRYFSEYISRQPDWELVEVYADEGLSGTSSDRPAFRRMLAAAAEGKIDLIFNTVPAPILTTEVLSDMKPPCFIIDLASLPGGVAADTMLPDGCRVLHALSLPGKVAPLSAARAVFDTVDTILHEEGIL